MIYFLYDMLLLLAYLVYLPVYAARGRVGSHILMRLGFFGRDCFRPLEGKDVVWIHAVSVGEARAAESLIRLIRAGWPSRGIVVSTVTPTGHEIAKRMLNENEIACYAPLDVSWVVRRFLGVLRPRLLIIMETEVWPHLIRLSRRRAAGVVVVNGRISDSSYRGYRRMRWLLRDILGAVDLFCMQNEESAQKVVSLGVPPQKVRTTGNIKFDISAALKESPALQRLKETLKDDILLVAGSTHENEEEVIVGIYKSLRKDFNSLRLLIAPRHLERLDKIRRMIRLHGMEAVVVSSLPARQAELPRFSSAHVILLDTMGDLNAVYQSAEIAFVGGSLVKKGGHNPIEPALFGKPVLFGRHMENFKEIRDVFIRQKAALEVDSGSSLEYELRKLLASPQERKALGQRAKSLVDENRGAAARTFAAISEMIEHKAQDTDPL